MAPDLQPAILVGPGELLQAELDARVWSQKDLAEIVGRPTQVINEIVRGTKQITPETSIQLGEAFGMSPEFWLNHDTAYRLVLALRQPRPNDVALRSRLYGLVPVAELSRRGWLQRTSTLAELSAAICEFLGIARPEDEPEVPIARLRRSITRTPESRSKIAWIRRAQLLVEEVSVSRFDGRTFKAQIGKIFELARSPDGILEVPDFLARLGVRLVFVPHLPRTYLDGATFWDDDGPVVVLTLRYDRLDYFWFTLGHELVHVLRRDKAGVIDEQSTDDPEEQAANLQASNWMIDPSALDDFLKSTQGRPNRGQIEAFAGAIERHPSIVVGRLQHDHVLTWAQLRDMHVGVRDGLGQLIDRSPDHSLGHSESLPKSAAAGF